METALNSSLKGDTHTQGCKGSQKRRASESRERERIRARKRKREMVRVVGSVFKAPLPRLFWLSWTTRGLETHFVQSIRNGLVAEGNPLHPICFTTVGGSTQQNTCCLCCFCRSADWSNELAVICDPSLKLHPGHFLQTVAPADTSDFHRVIHEWFGAWTMWCKVTKHTQ